MCKRESDVLIRMPFQSTGKQIGAARNYPQLSEYKNRHVAADRSMPLSGPGGKFTVPGEAPWLLAKHGEE
jgi:hypothetical protein